MIRSSKTRLLAAGLVLGMLSAGCAARSAYRQGRNEARKGNWDLAVARLTVALQKDPDNIEYKIALENAKIQAGRYYYLDGLKQLAAEDLVRAADSLEIATKYDPSNKSASDDLEIVRKKIREREQEKQRLSEFDAMKSRAQAARVPLPVLSPRSPVPITIKFSEHSLQKIFESLGKLAGVNVLFDQDFRDKKYSVSLSNATFQEALDQLTFVNRLFYKVLDQNTIIIVPETPQKRRTYDENLIRTFYLQNAEVNETLNQVKTLAGIQKATGNPTLGAITVMGTPDELALAERIIEANDKAKGEVMIEVEILNVDVTKAKNYGLQLSSYGAGLTFSPTGGTSPLPGGGSEVSIGTGGSGFTNVRAQLLSSLNLSDFIVSVPAQIFAQFLQTDSSTRILASPRLRAAEGKKTSLKIG
jgi:general secretion pathway protein D